MRSLLTWRWQALYKKLCKDRNVKLGHFRIGQFIYHTCFNNPLFIYATVANKFQRGN